MILLDVLNMRNYLLQTAMETRLIARSFSVSYLALEVVYIVRSVVK